MNDTTRPDPAAADTPPPVATAPKPRVARKTATAQAAAETAAKPATSAKATKARKPAKPVKPAAPVVAKAEKVEKVEKAEKTEKVKLVRDSFTIPASEYEVLATLKQRALKGAHPVKKSELLRAGISLLASLSDAALLAALQAVPAIKTGRPKGKKGE